MITEDELRALAAFRGEPVVVSLYLDIDGRRYPRMADVEPYLDQLVRVARERARRDGLPLGAVEEQLAHIEARVKEGFDRSRTRGVAFFASANRFDVIELPRPVRSQVVLNQSPALRQLEYLRDEYQPFVVALVDRQRARVFRFELGELVERREVFDRVSPRVDGTDDGGRMASHVQSRADEEARRHLRHAAEVLLEEVQESQADRVILGGPTEAVSELEELLHPYVSDRVVDRLSVSVQASDAEIRGAALAVEEAVERRMEAAVVERLREGLGPQQRSVTGLTDTLHALHERRVDLLVISHGYEAPGWSCPGCGALAARGRACPMCGSDMEEVDDVIGEAIDQALTTGADVEICENADLDVLGRVGALLRY